ARTELDELGFEEAAIDRVLDAFGGHRFLTFDRDPSTREPTVEIAHEAMLDDWTRLRDWIDDAREDLREARRLSRAAAEWRASDRDPSFLMRGARLEQADEWVRTTGLAVGANERAYVKAGVDLRDRESEEEQKRRAHEASMEHRSRARLRALVAVLTVAALVASGLTLIATNQSERAGREADRATRAAAIASARERAADAIANLEADPARSILLAMESVDRTRSVDGSVLPEAEEALHRAIAASRLVLSVRGAGGLLAWSPAGVFVTEGASGSGLIEIRDPETGGLVIPRFEGHQGDINDVAFSPDGSRLATAGADGALKVWDPSTGELLANWTGRGEVWGPSFDQDGTRLAATWNDEVVRVLDVRRGNEVMSVGVEFAIDTALDPEGDRVAVMTYFGRISTYVLDVRSGKVSLRLDAQNCCAIPQSRGVAWSPDGRSIATTNEGAALVWDAAGGRLRHTLRGHTGAVLAVAWSPDSSRLATGGSDGTAKVWEVGLGNAEELLSLASQEMKSGIVGVTFSPDATRVMAGDKAITAVNVWNISPRGDAEWVDLPPVGGLVPDVEFTPDGEKVVVEDRSRQIRGSEARAGSALAIRDARTGRSLRILGPASDAFWFVSFDVSPDGSTVAIGGGKGGCCNGRVRVWDMRTGKERFGIVYHLDVGDVAFSPNGGHMVSAGWDRGARVVDREGHPVATLREADGFVFERARFNPDGSLIATAAANRYEPETGRVRVWDWAEERVVRTIRVEAVSSLDFHPDGVRIAIAGYQGIAGIWDVSTGDPIVELAGHSGGVNDIAFSPDGGVVATAGFDGTVRIFDASTGDSRLVLRGHGCGVRRLDFSPDGSMLASAAACDGVRIWALDVDDLLRIARREVMPALTDDECRRLFELGACP
ncbi:MAG TPA: WD40 repeat domain-containing protein, partial [Actinomycetota bacterium]